MTAIGNYDAEANLCENAGAYLASCIMMSARIEGLLLICVSTFPEEAERALRRLQETKQIGKGLRLNSALGWDLGRLLKVAEEAQWLPSQLTRFFPLPPLAADTSNPLFADRIRELRNLVHPGRLVRERNGRTITREELYLLHDTCLAVSLHLAQKLAPEMFDPEMRSFRIDFGTSE